MSLKLTGLFTEPGSDSFSDALKISDMMAECNVYIAGNPRTTNVPEGDTSCTEYWYGVKHINVGDNAIQEDVAYVQKNEKKDDCS